MTALFDRFLRPRSGEGRAPQRAALVLALTSEWMVALEMQPSGPAAEVRTCAAQPMPSGCFAEDRIVDATRLGQQVAAFCRKHKIRQKATVVVLPSHLCTLRTLRLPEAPSSERRGLVRGELEHLQAISPGSSAFDFLWVAGAPGTPGASQPEVHAVCTSEQQIADLRACMRHAGLRLTCIEPSSIATMRGCLAAGNQDEPVAILSLDETHSDFCIYDHVGIRHLRRIPSGWGDLGEEADLAPPAPPTAPEPPPFPTLRMFGETPDAVDTPAPQASEPDPGFPALPAKPGGRAQATATLPFVVQEVVRSLAFYSRNDEAGQPRTLMVVGPRASLRRLDRELEEALRLPVQVVDAGSLGLRSTVQGDEQDELQALLLGAYGAGLATIGSGASFPRINLAHEPPRSAESEIWSRAGAPVLTVSAVVAALGLAAGAWLMFENGGLDSQMKLLTLDLQRVQREREPRQRTVVQLERLRSQREHLLPAESVLAELARNANSQWSLTTVDIHSDGRAELQGQALDTNSIQQLALKLGQSKSIREARIQELRQDASGTLQFRLACPLNYRPPTSEVAGVVP